MANKLRLERLSRLMLSRARAHESEKITAEVARCVVAAAISGQAFERSSAWGNKHEAYLQWLSQEIERNGYSN